MTGRLTYGHLAATTAALLLLWLIVSACGGADVPELVRESGDSESADAADPGAVSANNGAPVESVSAAETPTPLATPTPQAAASSDEESGETAASAEEPTPADADEDEPEPTPDPLVVSFCETDSTLLDALDALNEASDAEFGDALGLAGVAVDAYANAAPPELAGLAQTFRTSWIEASSTFSGPNTVEATLDSLDDWYFSDEFDQIVSELDDWIVGNCV